MFIEKLHTDQSIAFLDTEVNPKNGKILDIGCVKDNGHLFHKNSENEFVKFLTNTQFVCGHNIFNHDLKYIGNSLHSAGINLENVIDTLHLSPLLFPTKPYHALLKDDKLQSEDANNPLNDSIKARDLLNDEVAAFKTMDETLRQILFLLLKDQKEFKAFFKFIGYKFDNRDLATLIKLKFGSYICENVDLSRIILNSPTELAYCLSLIHSFVEHTKVYSIAPPWVLKNYPKVEHLMSSLRNKPCVAGCCYCNKALDAHIGLRNFFGFDAFRDYGGEPLQENAVKAAINNESLLAVFPTGGGKSITFQVPALMSGNNMKGLTVIISPLQSLMKDQVDNLEKMGITDAVTINGLLDPIERAKSYERVEDGSASLLYISPESLRSKTIERLILGRKIARFVIDEAHCFSSWGQDFRVDYLYIGDFIKSIQENKNLQEAIPVSCFTATAKQKVIEDIQDYFREKLSLQLQLFTSKASRTNLQYRVFKKSDEEEKYLTVRDLIEEKRCPCIVYVSRTQKAKALADRLVNDGFSAKAYHGKMDKQQKSGNQDAFIKGDTQIMVATSAFGMGVDKKDVGLVIHYEISDSLENYVQEAGRAGRDENILADCFVLFDEEDLSKHFILLNQTKLSIKEIQQIWKAIKELTKFRMNASNSALEIARKAGWDENVVQIETRVTTAISALEEAGYLKRGQNMPRVFANSILSKNAQEAIDKINQSDKFSGSQKEKGIRIIKKLFSSKSRKHLNEEGAESRIDYISDHLGIVKGEVIGIVNLLRQEKILADTKDLTAFIKKGDSKNRSLQILQQFCKVENFLFTILKEEEETINLKELNEGAELYGCGESNTNKIKTIINFWAIKNWIKKSGIDAKNHITVLALQSSKDLRIKTEKRQELTTFIVEYLFYKYNETIANIDADKDEALVEFSVHELKDAYEETTNLFKLQIDIGDVEDALFYLSRIEALKIEGGFLVIYNSLTIERVEQNNKKQYTREDYQKLNQFYENKIQQIHIVGEYAKKMLADYKDALQFVDDYFGLNYTSFLNKYFPGSRQKEIGQNITPSKFRQLFGTLSPTQLNIIKDNETKYAVVAAGPGSGKTRVLVHKLASLLLMEDVKHEQLLMVTFSRASVTEFKKRLLQLIGNAANYIEIKTFHSYCFDLLGKVGSIEKSGGVIKNTIEKIKSNEVEASRITKTVIVIDEAQDMDEDELELIYTLMEQNEDMRVIAVGDDDQNIYEFRGASAKHLEKFISRYSATKHELIHNYRSKNNLVDFSNQFVEQINNRMKQTPIIAVDNSNGRVRCVSYQYGNLIRPLVNDILSTDLSGTSCVLTKTNEEALQITGLLLKNNLKAKLIQSNEGFNLYNLLEVRYFLNLLNKRNGVAVIQEEEWLNARNEVSQKFKGSDKLEILLNIIREFETTNTKTKYKSDLEVFVRESKLEDFFNDNGETIFVSTIHKAKGKEFDNVFVLLENFNASTDEAKRQLYVAFTRAKINLTIHLNANFLDPITVDNLERIVNNEIHSPPEQLAMHLSFKDVWLDYFINKQSIIMQLESGNSIIVKGDECLDMNGNSVLKFSKQMVDRVNAMKLKKYELKSAKVNFMLFWKKEGSDQEIAIILPELYFERVEEKSIF